MILISCSEVLATLYNIYMFYVLKWYSKKRAYTEKKRGTKKKWKKKLD